MNSPDFLPGEPPPYGGGGKSSSVLEYLRKQERALKRGDAAGHTHRTTVKELLEALNGQIISSTGARLSPGAATAKRVTALVNPSAANAGNVAASGTDALPPGSVWINAGNPSRGTATGR